MEAFMPLEKNRIFFYCLMSLKMTYFDVFGGLKSSKMCNFEISTWLYYYTWDDSKGISPHNSFQHDWYIYEGINRPYLQNDQTHPLILQNRSTFPMKYWGILINIFPFMKKWLHCLYSIQCLETLNKSLMSFEHPTNLSEFFI